MSDTVIITHPCTHTCNILGTQVAAISSELLIFKTSSVEEMQKLCKEYGCTLLLIDSSLCHHQMILSALPEETAILFLSETEAVEEFLNDLLFTRNCNLHKSSAAENRLQYKVQLLLKQRATTRELLLARKTINELTEELIHSKQSQKTQQRYLDILSERDGLTGLYNRKHLTSALRHEFQRAKRYKSDLSLLLLDIDNFKAINQNHGHLFGDFVLNEIAARLTSNTRDSDLCYRFGGGNFIILLPHSNISHGYGAAEKLNRCCSLKSFDNGQNNQKVTISIGVASICASHPETPDQLINMADRAMYQAKSMGKDRCQAHQNESNKKHEKAETD